MKVAVLAGKIPSGGAKTYIEEVVKGATKHLGVSFDKFVWNTSVLTKKDKEKLANSNTNDGWTLLEHDNYTDVSNMLSSYDYVFCVYHVCYKQVHEDEIQDYINMIKDGITTNKAIFFNEHNPTSIKHNYGENYICRKDVLLSFNKIVQFGFNIPSANLIKTIIGEDEYVKRFIPMHHPYEFSHQSEWVSASKKLNTIEYLGRFVNLKDPQRLIRMKDTLDKYGFIAEMRGLIRMISLIGIPDLCYKFVNGVSTNEPSDKCFWTSKKWLSENGLENNEAGLYIPANKRDNKIFIYGEYNNKTVYDDIKNSGFACDFFHLKHAADYAGHCNEYCMYEFIDYGIIPVLDSEVGKNCYFLKNDKFTDVRFDSVNSAIYVDKDLSNVEDAVKKMNELMKNPEEYDAFRNESYNYFKAHTDPKSIVTNLFDELISKKVL